MYQLYGASGSCSMTTHVLLIAMRQPYEYHSMTMEKMKAPDFIQLNPRGNVPTLTDEGFVVRENVAIITYLCDKHGCSGWTKNLNSHERATQLQWLAYCNSTLHGAYAWAFKAAFGAFQNEQTKQDVLALAQGQIQSYWDELNQVLSTCTYLCGNEWGPADIYMTVIAGWNAKLPLNLKLGTNVQRVIDACCKLPAFQQAAQEEHFEYSNAA